MKTQIKIAGITFTVDVTDIETLRIAQKFGGMTASYGKLLEINGSKKLFENALQIAVKSGTELALELGIGKPNRRCGRLTLAHLMESAINVLYFAADANVFYEKQGLFLEMVCTALVHDSVEDSVSRDKSKFSYDFAQLEADLLNGLENSCDIIGVTESDLVQKILENVKSLTIPLEKQTDKTFTIEQLFAQLGESENFNSNAFYVRLCETISALGNLELLGFSNGGVLNIADKENFYIPKIVEMADFLNEILAVPASYETTSERIERIFQNAVSNAKLNNAHFVKAK